jgi:hypothetical protein
MVQIQIYDLQLSVSYDVQKYKKDWRVNLFWTKKMKIKTENQNRNDGNRRQMTIFIADEGISDSKCCFLNHL